VDRAFACVNRHRESNGSKRPKYDFTVHNAPHDASVGSRYGRFISVIRLTRRRISILTFIVLLLTFGLAKHAALLRGAASWWVVSDCLNESADAIVVLGGGFETRPDAAADLYKRGLGNRIIVVDSENPTFEKLQKLGVPTAFLIKLGSDASSTYEEAFSVLNWAETNGAKDIVVPTDFFHTRRVRWIFSKVFGATGIRVKVIAINQLNYSKDDWWQYKKGWTAFQTEIIKYLFYRVKY